MSVVSIAGEGTPGVPNPRFDKLEGLLTAARQLETQLAQERHRTRQLGEDLKAAQTTYDRLLQESETRNRELTLRANKAHGALAARMEREKRFFAQARALQAEFEKVRAELNHYKQAWSSVLLREREAKEIIVEGQETARSLTAAEKRLGEIETALRAERERREQAERHAKSYQAELQSALVRIHSAESRFNELSKEYQLVAQAKRNFDQEVQRIELSMRERFQWELIKERERLKAELERESALEREKHREQLLAERETFRETVRAEIREQYERRLDEQRGQLQQQARAEAARAAEQTAKAADELARMQAQAEEQAVEASRARGELVAARLDAERRVQAVRAELESRLQEKGRELVEAEVEAGARQAELSQALAALRARFAESEDRLAGALERIRVTAIEAATFQNAAAEGQAELERVRAGASALRERLEASRTELGARISEIAGLQDEVASYEAAFSQEFERSRSLERELILDRRRLGQASDELEASVLDDRMETMRLDVEQLQRRLENLVDDPAMPRRLERDIAQLVQQREEMKRALGEWRRDLRQRAARIRLLSEAGAITAGPAAAEKARDPAWVDGAGPEMKHLPVQ